MLIKRISDFMLRNDHRLLTVKCYIYSLFIRMKLRTNRVEDYHRTWGEEGRESKEKESDDNYRYAWKVSYVVNRICEKTPWKSRCLVRALTARRLLNEKKVSSTLYLGCAKREGEFVAHAWLRCGRLYLTGGLGQEYAVVSTFCNEWD